jgi:hypothetical protein
VIRLLKTSYTDKKTERRQGAPEVQIEARNITTGNMKTKKPLVCIRLLRSTNMSVKRTDSIVCHRIERAKRMPAYTVHANCKQAYGLGSQCRPNECIFGSGKTPGGRDVG